jgi:hypothetical protein
LPDVWRTSRDDDELNLGGLFIVYGTSKGECKLSKARFDPARKAWQESHHTGEKDPEAEQSSRQKR